MTKITTIFLIQILFICVLNAQEVTPAIKVSNYEIDAKFIPEKSFFEAKTIVVLTGKTMENIEFYLHGEINIDSIYVDGSALDYEEEKVYYSDNYSLIANKTVIKSEPGNLSGKKIEIYYSGYFNPSKARSGSDYMRITPTEGVLLRSFGYSLWFPVFLADKQDSYSTNFEKVTIRTPKKLKAVVTGQQIKEYVEGNERITIWKPGLAQIHAVQCTALEYAVFEKKNISVYHKNNKASLQNSKEILEFSNKLQKLFSQKYIQTSSSDPLYIMEMPKYGDISSGNVVGIQSRKWKDFNKQIWPKITLAHELVHPYVQLPVLKTNPFYAFIIEGFPSYFHYLALIETEGEEFYNKNMGWYEKNYIYKKKHGKHPRGWSIPKEKAILDITDDEIGEYKDCFILSDRVLLFFNHLRQKMSKEDFNKYVKELFSLKSIDYKIFETLTVKYLPDFKNDLSIWLKGTEFPDRFLIKNS